MEAVYPPPADYGAQIKSLEEYQELYKESINNPEAFWGNLAEDFHWEKRWDKAPYSRFFFGLSAIVLLPVSRNTMRSPITPSNEGAALFQAHTLISVCNYICTFGAQVQLRRGQGQRER
jgi:Acetyl-coenzyme A synthetase N-terminus